MNEEILRRARREGLWTLVHQIECGVCRQKKPPYGFIGRDPICVDCYGDVWDALETDALVRSAGGSLLESLEANGGVLVFADGSLLEVVDGGFRYTDKNFNVTESDTLDGVFA